MTERLDILAQKALDEQGYVILADPLPLDVKVGECLTHLRDGYGQSIETRLRVIGDATKEEFSAQCKLLGYPAFPSTLGRYVKVVAE